MTGEFSVKFELVVDEFINEDILTGVGKSEVEILVLGFPGLGDAGERRVRLGLCFEADAINGIGVDEFSLLFFLEFLIFIEEELHFMDLIEGIFELFFNVVFVFGLFGDVLFGVQGANEFVVFDQNDLIGSENDQ